YALNEFFRRDVYVKGAGEHTPDATAAYLDTTPFGTLVPAGRLARSVRLPHYTVDFHGPVYDAVLAALAEQPVSALELARRPDLAAFDLDRIRETLSCTLLGDEVGPMRPDTPALAPPPRSVHVPSSYNRMILAQELGPDSVVALAAHAAATGFVVRGPDLLALRALAGLAPPGREGVGAGEVEQFRVEQAPKLLQLGVLASGEAR